jgi:hypothetical protein
LGVTGVIDAGGGYQNYPGDYAVIEELHCEGRLTLRIAYNLFTQKPKGELQDFASWAKLLRPGQGDDLFRHNGAGEMLVYTAADFEDFRVPRPDMPPSMEADPLRQHRGRRTRWPPPAVAAGRAPCTGTTMAAPLQHPCAQRTSPAFGDPSAAPAGRFDRHRGFGAGAGTPICRAQDANPGDGP